MKKQKDNETAITDVLEAPVAPAAPAVSKKDDLPPEKKMTIYEYEEKYVKRENSKAATWILRLLVVALAVLFIWCFFTICKSVWEFNKYAGYASIAVAVVLFIIFYIVPVYKIFKLDYFVTNVNYKTAAAAKRKNKKLRFQIAEKIVELCNTVAGVGWYDSYTVEKLEAGVKFHDDGIIKEQLTALYSGSVKKSAKSVIFKCAMKSAMYSALSQDSKIDTMMVAVVNLQMIKDIVFLYGFRPSDTRLLRIFASVIRNSMIAYGLGGLKLGSGVARTVGDAAKGIPFLGTVIATLVDSSVQGLTNGTLTAVIGFQTLKYLNTEYKLQNILDGVEIDETEEELAETCTEIEKELKKNKKGVAPAI